MNLLKKLKEYFGAELDWYGSGENPIKINGKALKTTNIIL